MELRKETIVELKDIFCYHKLCIVLFIIVFWRAINVHLFIYLFFIADYMTADPLKDYIHVHCIQCWLATWTCRRIENRKMWRNFMF